MARVAKIFGFLCTFGALFEVLLAGLLLVGSDRRSTSSNGPSALDVDPETGVVGVLLLGLPVLAFLLLLTVGAAAYVVGEMAERQVAEHSKRLTAPIDRAYGASARS